eukprot:6194603-Pleurochrysis_carterae.AAC.1
MHGSKRSSASALGASYVAPPNGEETARRAGGASLLRFLSESFRIVRVLSPDCERVSSGVGGTENTALDYARV